MESILLSNIAAILAKDVLIDRRKKSQIPIVAVPPNYSLLASDDDEDFEFFLRQRNLQDFRTQITNQTIKTICPSETRSNKRPEAWSAKSESIQNKKRIKDSSPLDVFNSTIPPSNKYVKQIEVNLLNKFNGNEFEANLHMSKISFLRIFQSLRQHLLPADLPRNIPPQSVFSLALWKLTTDEHFEDIARKFHIPIGICQQVIRLFWRRISAKYETLIKWPNTMQKREHNMRNFQKHCRHNAFQHILGVVAIKRLDVFLEDINQDVAVVLQVICDADYKVIDCFLELAADYAFDASPIGQMLALNIQTLPIQNYLIGDTNCPLKTYLMRPFETPCEASEHTFNTLLQPLLCIGRQVLDAMAKRFNSLYALEARHIHEVRKIVDTVCTLHNLCITLGDDYVERKQEESRFQWANSSTEERITVHAAEQNEQGKQKRTALLELVAAK